MCADRSGALRCFTEDSAPPRVFGVRWHFLRLCERLLLHCVGARVNVVDGYAIAYFGADPLKVSASGKYVLMCRCGVCNFKVAFTVDNAHPLHLFVARATAHSRRRTRAFASRAWYLEAFGRVLKAYFRSAVLSLLRSAHMESEALFSALRSATAVSVRHALAAFSAAAPRVRDVKAALQEVLPPPVLPEEYQPVANELVRATVKQLRPRVEAVRGSILYASRKRKPQWLVYAFEIEWLKLAQRRLLNACAADPPPGVLHEGFSAVHQLLSGILLPTPAKAEQPKPPSAVAALAITGDVRSVLAGLQRRAALKVSFSRKVDWLREHLLAWARDSSRRSPLAKRARREHPHGVVAQVCNLTPHSHMHTHTHTRARARMQTHVCIAWRVRTLLSLCVGQSPGSALLARRARRRVMSLLPPRATLVLLKRAVELLVLC